RLERVERDPEGNTLYLVHDVPDPKDSKYVRGMRFVSPEIHFDFEVAPGRKLPGGTITHVAATAMPVQQPQVPIEVVALSGAVRLSWFDYSPPVRLGETPMAEEKETKSEGGEGEGVGEGKKLKKLLEVLASVGLVLPDDTTPETLLERLE